MRIGKLDVCLRVSQVERSLSFYKKLGFQQVEGGEGWAIVSNGEARLGLFTEQYMGNNLVSLNFRGGNIREICQSLADSALTFEAEPNYVGVTGGSAALRDPDGHLVFLDTTAEEAQAYQT